MKGNSYRTILIISGSIVIGLIILLTIRYLVNNMNDTNNTNATKRVVHVIRNNNQRDYNNPALYHSTKSVDGEHQYSDDTQWKSQPSKCFDCETQMKETCGDACVYKGTKQKVFDM